VSQEEPKYRLTEQSNHTK